VTVHGAIIVDDEPLARERVRTLLERHDRWNVLAECGDGEEAVRTIESQGPDLVFLDIQMPQLDGFGVLEALGPARMPAVIFVTAFDEFALKAFDVSAVDYLLKPIEPERFDVALQRAIDRIEGRGTRADMSQLLAYWRRQQPANQRFVVRTGGRITLVKASEIDWIDAAGNYVRLHTAGGSHLVRDTMNAVEQRLDPAVFLRVHRSAIVNIDRVSSLEPYFHGEYVVIMRDGTRLTTSRSHSRQLRALLKI
jgi:two-component system LytT family response regulator